MPASLCQVAFSVLDGRRASEFYRDVLGLVPAGGTQLFRGYLTSRVQGLPRARSTTRWLIDDGDFFQLEMFQFDSPRPRPAPLDQGPTDIGYRRVSFQTPSVGEAFDRALELGATPIAGPEIIEGVLRASFFDPDRVVVELVEQPTGAPRLVSVTAVVPSLAASRAYFVDALGCEVLAPHANCPVREARTAIFGLPGSATEASRLVLDLGGRYLELIEYRQPRPRPRPADYRISDQGLLNIALGFRDPRRLRKTYERALAAGYRPNFRPLNLGGLATVVYLNDHQGFSVELLQCRPVADRLLGFKSPPAWARRVGLSL